MAAQLERIATSVYIDIAAIGDTKIHAKTFPTLQEIEIESTCPVEVVAYAKQLRLRSM